jgi:hypothetical protein
MSKALVRALLCVTLVLAVILAGSGTTLFPAPFLESSSVVLRLVAPYGHLLTGAADDDCPPSDDGCIIEKPPGDEDPPPEPPPPSPPSISGSVSCASPGSNGWCRGGAVINLHTSDPQGYATTITGDIAGEVFSCAGPSCSRTLPEGSGAIHFQARTAATGLSSATGSKTWAYDKTPPSLSVIGPAPDGLDGWYAGSPTWTLTASDATSGLASAAFSGAGSSITVTEDGVTNISALAVDNAGNTTPWSLFINRDATPPKSFFSQPIEGSKLKVAGDVPLSGASADALSGLASAEISLDEGGTWQALSPAGKIGAWAYLWETSHFPDGLYTILVRADDKAGNRGNTARVRVIVGNRPPKVEIQPSWWLRETGYIKVQQRQIELRDVTLRISCAPYHPDVVLTFTGEHVPADVKWDRRCGNGAYAAESGNYRVTVTACDVFGQCAEASGVIKIPVIPPTSTLTAQPTSTPVTAAPSPTARAKKATATSAPTIQKVVAVIAPTATPTPAPAPRIPASPTGVFALSAFALGFCFVALSDRRPRALRRLARTLRKLEFPND